MMPVDKNKIDLLEMRKKGNTEIFVWSVELILH